MAVAVSQHCPSCVLRQNRAQPLGMLPDLLAPNGDLLLGLPIAEATHETNGDGSGRVYEMQWFANGRLEYHPEHTGMC